MYESIGFIKETFMPLQTSCGRRWEFACCYESEQEVPSCFELEDVMSVCLKITRSVKDDDCVYN